MIFRFYEQFKDCPYCLYIGRKENREAATLLSHATIYRARHWQRPVTPARRHRSLAVPFTFYLCPTEPYTQLLL